MATKYCAALFLFMSYSAQSMDIKTCLKSSSVWEDEYVICVAPMLMLLNKECSISKEFTEFLCRQEWKNKKSSRQEFKNMFSNLQPNTNLDDGCIENTFVADMVPLMMSFDRKGFATENACEMMARHFWKGDSKLCIAYQKKLSEPVVVSHGTLNNLPEQALNRIASFTRRFDNAALRCVNKEFNAKIKPTTTLLVLKDELLEAIKDGNTSSVKILTSRAICNSRFITTIDMYHCIEAAMEQDKNDDILKMLINATEHKGAFFEENSYSFKGIRTSLMLQAMEKNNILLMRVLASHGATNSGYWGVKPLMYAVENGKIELVEELITYPGLDIDDKNNSESQTALCLALKRIQPMMGAISRPGPYYAHYREIVRLLLGAGADPEIADYNGCTPRELISKAMAERAHIIYDRPDPELVEIAYLIQQAIDKKHPLADAGADVKAVKTTDKWGFGEYVVAGGLSVWGVLAAIGVAENLSGIH